MAPTHYAVLGVPPEALPHDVRAAYRLRLLATHPDKVGDQKLHFSVTQITAAYSVLADAQRRARYDAELLEALKHSGALLSGDGVDVHTLAEFDEAGGTFSRDCPRCTSTQGMLLSETDLEEGTPDGCGGLYLMVQCQSCSLWINVSYEEE